MLRKDTDNIEKIGGTRPATTPEAKEAQLISLAVDLAEKKLRDGSASNQLITHYLKLATTRESLEKERLIEENKLLKAKTEALQSQQRSEEMYAEVLAAFKRYSGNMNDEAENEFYD